MLHFQLIENTDERVTYRYYPERDIISGYITVRKADFTIIESELASNDEFRWYFLKMFCRIKEFIAKNDFKESGIIAWY